MGPFIPSITLTDSDGVTNEIWPGEMMYMMTDGMGSSLGLAMTSKGRKVNVVKADLNALLNMQYFCHGHSLGTYRRFGYSVISGVHILFALQDDYVEFGARQTVLGAMQLLKVGDIVSFEELSGKIVHSAIVSSIDINPSDPLRPIQFAEIILSTKNNYDAVCLQSILAVRELYSEAPKMTRSSCLHNIYFTTFTGHSLT
jgi:hypothetical protein